MAKTITYTAPFDKVENVAGTLQSGGSLDASTDYYVMVYALDEDSKRQGEVSDTFNFTTTATDKQIDLTWDAVSGATYYRVLVDTESDFSSNRCAIRGASSEYTTNTNSYTVTGSDSTYYPMHKATISQDLPGGLDKNLGTGIVEIDGGTAGDPITPSDIHAVIGTDQSYLDETNWFADVLVEVKDDTYFAVEDMNIVVAHFYETDSSAEGEVRFGDLDDTAPDPSKITTLQFLCHSGIRPTYRSGIFKFYGTILKSQGRYEQTVTIAIYPLMVYGDGATFVDVKYGDTLNAKGDFEYTGTIAGLAVSNQDYTKLTNIYVDSYTAWSQPIDALYYEGSIRNVRVANRDRSGRTIRRNNGSGHEDEIFTFVNLTIGDADDNIPYIYWYDTSNDKGRPVHLEYSLDLKVIDVEGNAIEGATVIAIDSSGTQEFSVTTDSDGEIATQDLLRLILSRNDVGPTTRGMGPDYTEYTYKTPHTITILKTGYETKTIILTMDREREEVQVLENRREV